jgi:hypothetical protein
MLRHIDFVKCLQGKTARPRSGFHTAPRIVFCILMSRGLRGDRTFLSTLNAAPCIAPGNYQASVVSS